MKLPSFFTIVTPEVLVSTFNLSVRIPASQETTMPSKRRNSHAFRPAKSADQRADNPNLQPLGARPQVPPPPQALPKFTGANQTHLNSLPRGVRNAHSTVVPPPTPRTQSPHNDPSMADPFEVRMRFTSQLQHLNASVTSAQKAANYALRYRDMDEDLHSCILEQLERVSQTMHYAPGYSR